MDGFTDSALRRICKEVSPDIVVFTEFTSAEGLAHDAGKIKARFRFVPQEQPVIAQIFGSDLASFTHAAAWLEAQGFAGVEINMGCPSRKIVKSECGIALRKDHDRAFRLIDAVARHTALPVSVKTRLGLTDASDLLTFGKGCENAGANLITVHGRTYDEPYGVPANFAPIYELKRHVAIPVLGNGGITSRTDGQAKRGNLDGFLIGQAAIGNPWVFTDQPVRPLAEKVPTILRHVDALVGSKGPVVGIREMRKHLLAYVKAEPNAKALRSQLAYVTTRVETENILYNALETHQCVVPALKRQNVDTTVHSM